MQLPATLRNLPVSSVFTFSHLFSSFLVYCDLFSSDILNAKKMSRKGCKGREVQIGILVTVGYRTLPMVTDPVRLARIVFNADFSWQRATPR